MDDNDVGRRLDQLPITQRHWVIFLIVGVGLVVDAIDLTVMSGIAGALISQGAGVGDISLVAQATAAGLGAGALVGGVGGDWLGRRAMVLLASAVITMGTLGAVFSDGIETLAAWRAVTALGLGAENVLAYGVLIEFLPSRVRGRWLARLAVLATLAGPVALAAGYYVLPSPDGWRWLLLCVFVLSLTTFAMRFLLPESPRWLAARGREDQAARIVNQLERSAGSRVADVTAPPTRTPSTGQIHPAGAGIAPTLWSRAMATRLALAGLINIALVSATMGFVAWLPTFFAAEGHALSTALMTSFVMASGAPVGALIGMLVSDRFERRWSSAIAALVAALAGCTYAIAPGEMLLCAGFTTVAAIYAFGAIALSGYMPELFPTSIRMRAIGIAITTGRIVAFILPPVIAFVFAFSGQAGVVSMIAFLLLAAAGALAAFGVSTHQRATDEI